MKSHFWSHPTAIVESNAVGCGTRVWAFTHIMAGASIGEECNIGEQCFIESGAVIGSHVTIKNGNLIWEGITLEDGVFVGPHATFTNDLYPRSPRLDQAKARYVDRGWLKKTRVRLGASIGAAAVILPNVTIEPFALVAAGTVVTRDVPSHALMIGNPARLAGWVCECGQPIRFERYTGVCSFCERLFTLRDGKVEKMKYDSSREETVSQAPAP